jgi:hypothetical protein
VRPRRCPPHLERDRFPRAKRCCGGSRGDRISGTRGRPGNDRVARRHRSARGDRASDALSGHKDGPVPVTGTLSTIASLPIPNPGSYVIFAKAELFDTLAQGENPVCELVAGTVEVDGSRRGSDVDRSASTIDNTLGHVTLALNVVHPYTRAGTADLQCGNSPGSTDAYNIKITAVRVGTLTNTILP